MQTNTVANFVRADTDQLFVADNASFASVNAMTLLVWTKPDDNTTSSFVCKYNDSGGREFLMRSVSGGPRFYISTDGTATDFAGAGAINTSEWNFLIGRHDSSLGSEQIKIYHGTSAGGALSTDTTTEAGARNNSGTELTISGYATNTEHMDGLIGPVAMWSVALTDDQVTWLYNAGAGRNYEDIATSLDANNPGVNNMVSYWPLHESSGTRVDLHGNNDLTDENTVAASSGYIVSPSVDGWAIATAVDQEGDLNVTQATEANKPSLAQRGLYHAAVFDGATDYLRGAIAGGASTIIDDDDAGWSKAGSWTVSTSAGFNGDHEFSAAGSGTDTQTWTFTVTPGLYAVYATWPVGANRATNTPFIIKDNTTTLATLAINQETLQTDLSESGAVWKLLGAFNITSTSLVVQITDAANEFVIADAILIKPVDGVLQPTTMFVVSKFEASGVESIAVDGIDSIVRQSFGMTASNKPFIQANTQVADDADIPLVPTIYTIQFNGASSKLWKNGILQTTGNAGTEPLSGLTIGARYDGGSSFFDGDIYEIVIADAVMDNADMNVVGAFFGAKYSLNWNNIS